MRILLISVVLTLVSCNKQTKKSDKAPEMNNTKEITSEIDYNLIFDNEILDSIPIKSINIGEVYFESGKIIVCDPLVYSNTKPLNRVIPPGKYPVKIYIAETPDRGDRYAAAKLEVNNEKAEKWVLALREDEDINELEQGEYFGFGVDAGLAGIFDEKAAIAYEKLRDVFYEQNPEGNIYLDVFEAEFKKNAISPEEEGSWINYNLPNTPHNITMFQSGWGDGLYPVYYGIGKNGDITSIVIDFLIFPSEEE